MTKKQNSEIVLSDLELHEVFPFYSYIYHYVKSHYNSKWKSPYTTLNSELSARCQKFINNYAKGCNKNICSVNFLYLGRYLYYLKQHFKDEYDINKVYACTYFSYKLKQELKNFCSEYNSSNDKDLKDAYDKIITIKGNYLPHNEQNFNVCQGNKLIENFDEETLNIFRDLDELYKNFYEIKGREWNISYREIVYDIFKRLLSHPFVENNKHNINDVLMQYKKEYDGYRHCRSWKCTPTILKLPEVTYISSSSTPTQNKTTTTSAEKQERKVEEGKVQVPKEKKTGNKAKENELLEALAQEAGNEEKLVEYTVLGSYLHPRTRKLKKQMKKRNNIHLDLMDTFERSYNDSYANTYEIGYRSLDY